jgi:hypothetical protein
LGTGGGFTAMRICVDPALPDPPGVAGASITATSGVPSLGQNFASPV